MNLKSIANVNDFKLNYPNISVNGLQTLLKLTKINNKEYLDKQRLIFQDLIYRFYVLKEDFNLFSIIEESHSNYEPLNKMLLEYRIIIIQIELKNNVYSENFIEFFINSIDKITTKLDTNFNINQNILESIISRLYTFKSDNIVLNQKVNNLIENYNLINEERQLSEKSSQKDNCLPTTKHIEKIKISVSKLNRAKLMDALDNIHIYDDKSKISLIKKGLRLYPYETLEKCADEAFILAKKHKIPNLSVPFYAILEFVATGVKNCNGYRGVRNSDIDELRFSSLDEKNEYFIDYLKKNIKNVDNTFENYFNLMLLQDCFQIMLLSHHNTKFNSTGKNAIKQLLFNLIDAVLPIFNDITNYSVSNLINTNIQIRSEYFIIKYISKYSGTLEFDRYPNIEYVNGEYIYTPKLITVNKLQSYLYIRKLLLDYIPYDKLESKYQEFSDMIFDLNIDNDYLNGNKPIDNLDDNNTFKIELKPFNIKTILREKSLNSKLNKHELSVLTSNKCAGLMNLFEDTFYSSINDAMFPTLISYIDDILNEFEFSGSTDLAIFLKSPLYKYLNVITNDNNYSDFIMEKINGIVNSVIEKLKHDRPKETTDLFNFFENDKTLILNYYEQTYCD
ncbi:hypothetical protein ACSW8S_15245 (plasmid) [Clostridium perfringens]